MDAPSGLSAARTVAGIGLTRAQPARTVAAAAAVRDLQDAERDLNEFRNRSGSEAAALEAKRAAAVQRQLEHDDLKANRDGLARHVARLEHDMGATAERLRQIEREAGGQYWRGASLADHALEWARHQMFLSFAPQWLESGKGRLAALDEELKKF